MERNIALKLMYNGTAYHGWQVQKNAVSVAETLEKALAATVGHPVKCTGAGRTDAGVHAETYVANFRTTSRIPLDKLPLAANTRLPDDIVVVKATQVPDGFNAIGSCLKKEYTYRIYNSRLGNPFYVNRAWFYPKHLDETVMARAAAQFVGTHDFRAHGPLFRRGAPGQPDRMQGVRQRLFVQHGPGYGGHRRLRRRGQAGPRGHPRHFGVGQPYPGRAYRTPRRAVHDKIMV